MTPTGIVTTLSKVTVAPTETLILVATMLAKTTAALTEIMTAAPMSITLAIAKKMPMPNDMVIALAEMMMILTQNTMMIMMTSELPENTAMALTKKT